MLGMPFAAYPESGFAAYIEMRSGVKLALIDEQNAGLVEEVIGREGGYSNHPADKGGATRWGVTEAVARAHGFRGDMRAFPRAEAVGNHLMGQGLMRDRFIITGAGESRPIASNDTEAGRAQNRRVEITLVPLRS